MNQGQRYRLQPLDGKRDGTMEGYDNRGYTNDDTGAVLKTYKESNTQTPPRDTAVVTPIQHGNGIETNEVTVEMPEGREIPRLTDKELRDTLAKIRRNFSQYVDKDGQISRTSFMSALAGKKESFFAERFFHFMDQDKSGTIDMEEIIEGSRILLAGTPQQRVKFIFTLYDTDGNGAIDRDELNQVMTSCVLEAKMKLNENEIALLSNTLFDETDTSKNGTITESELAAVYLRFPDTLDTLSRNAMIWLQPDLRPKDKKEHPLLKIFTRRYIANNAKKLCFIGMFWLVSFALFALNAYLYRDKNKYIIFARGCGMCLNFTSALILILPLRMLISSLRLTPVTRILPLDHNISIHKMVGMVIAFWTVGHTAGHLGNAIWLTERTNLTLPEILFTTKAKIGFIAYLAPLTGVILDVILLIMVVASRPFVRRSGYFQTFFWTHKLYYAYYILGILHAPNFWKWMVLPVVIFIGESIFNFIWRRGGTSITEVSMLPSQVIQLVITKPSGFNYKAGDYVYLKIPAIAKYEWHPFTISSAPEQDDTFFVHIRTAGHWTKTLRQYFLTHSSDQRNSGTCNSSFDAQKSRRASSLAWAKRKNTLAQEREASIRRRTITKDVDVQVFVDGPYGSPCREIFEVEHAILIGSGIGVTPFASILQSVVYRFQAGCVKCPNCHTSWCHAPKNLMNLKKVDFVWINRDQSNFEWFSSLLCFLEKEQSKEASLSDAITMHMFMTAAPNQNEINGIGVQMALDLVHKARGTDLLTGLATRTQGGRPNFNKLFRDIKKKSRYNKIKVFFCGSNTLAKSIQHHTMRYGIAFSKEHF